MTGEKEFGLVMSSLHCFFAGKHLMIMLYSPRFTAHYFRIARKKAPVITITACLGAFSLSEITWCKYLGLKCYSCRRKVYSLIHLGKRVVLYCHYIVGFPAILSEESKEAKIRVLAPISRHMLGLELGQCLGENRFYLKDSYVSD